MKVYILWICDYNVDGERSFGGLYSSEARAQEAYDEYESQYDIEDREAVEYWIELEEVY